MPLSYALSMQFYVFAHMKSMLKSFSNKAYLHQKHQNRGLWLQTRHETQIILVHLGSFGLPILCGLVSQFVLFLTRVSIIYNTLSICFCHFHSTSIAKCPCKSLVPSETKHIKCYPVAQHVKKLEIITQTHFGGKRGPPWRNATLRTKTYAI